MNATRACTTTGCNKRHYARGLCSPHYLRAWRRGEITPVAPMDRFWSKVNKTESCWNWTGSLNAKGYGYFTIDGRNCRVHRIAFEASRGSIPDDVVVDHICHNRACVNPQHLRLATPKQNNENRKGAAINSQSGVRGVCRRTDTGKWLAQVTHRGKQVYRQEFDTKGDAETAVIAARNKHFTHNEVDRASWARAS